jgi:hypothetical protein
MDPRDLTVYKSRFPKVRLGKYIDYPPFVNGCGYTNTPYIK